MKHTCDVLYIHACKNPLGEDAVKYAFMPMGLVAILNQLRASGINVLGLNTAIETKIDPNFTIPAALQEIDYKILLVDLHWYEHAFGAMYTVEQSKILHPDRPTIIGGYTSTIFSHEIMENFPQVDYIITGDSELPAQQLVDRLLGRTQQEISQIPNLVYRKDGTITDSDCTWVQTTLNELDCVTTDMFLHSELFPYVSCNGVHTTIPLQWICVARGCKYNCAYCCGSNHNMETLFRRCKILLRSPEKLAEDFLALEKKGIQWVCPSHDMQMFGKAYYDKLFACIREKNIKPGLYLECFQLPNKDFIDGIAETFDAPRTVLTISPISGNEQLRKENGKYFSNDAFYEIVDYIQQKGITLNLYYTVNPIGETREQFYDTYFQLKYFHDLVGMTNRQVYYQRVVLDPLAAMREREGINSQLNTFMDYYRYCQIPTGNFDYTGYESLGEVSDDEKQEIYRSIFG